MNPFEMLFVPMVLFMVIVAPTWIVMHYRSVNRSSSQLSEDDRQALEEMLVQWIKWRVASSHWSRYSMPITQTGARSVPVRPKRGCKDVQSSAQFW